MSVSTIHTVKGRVVFFRKGREKMALHHLMFRPVICLGLHDNGKIRLLYRAMGISILQRP